MPLRRGVSPQNRVCDVCRHPAIMAELNALKTVIGAVYPSPSKPFKEAYYDMLIGLAKSKKFIFGGDRNAKHTDWNSRLITSRGRKLARHADRNKYAISAPDSLTYYPHQGNAKTNVLDIFLHDMELPVLDVVTLDELNSDHNPVLFTVKCSMQAQLKLNEFPSDSFLSTDDLETGIETFTNTLRSAKIAG